MKGKLLTTLLFLLFGLSIFAHENHSHDQARFIENKGQWHENVKYKVEINGGSLYLENTSFNYQFLDLINIHPHDPEKPSGIKGHNFKVNFIGANTQPNFKNGNASVTDYNYFYGKDPDKWVSGAKAMHSVEYSSLYPNIDLKIYTNDGLIKYDFMVSPEGDPNQIKLEYEGVSDIAIKDGNLLINHSLGQLMELKPYAYQIINGEKVEVMCDFVLDRHTLTFSLPEGYDDSKELIIDPTLIFSTFSGSTADNWGMTATYDKDGNAYNGGTVFGQGYKTTIGSYDSTYNSAGGSPLNDVAITKYSSDGSQMLFSTYLGGSSAELVHSMIVNDSNELIIFGATGSSNFPVTTNAFDTSFNGGTEIFALALFSGGSDVYITKFNSDGNAIMSSTFLGGSLNDGINYNHLAPYPPPFSYSDSAVVYGDLVYNYGDEARGEINLDKDGNIYIASCTHSIDFPLLNGFDTQLNGHQDGLVSKLSADLSTLIYSTFIGGSEYETGVSVKIDTTGLIFIGGGTTSNDFPTTIGTYEENYNGGIADGYIAVIDPKVGLIAATYIGTSNYDQVYSIEVDRFGYPYFYAQSKGGLFPVINAKYNVTNGSILVGKMNPLLDSIIFSTKIGNLNSNGNGDGLIDLTPTAFLIDRCQNIYISGWGGKISTEVHRPPLNNMPITGDAFKSTTHGLNFYIAVIERDADSLLFGTYFGGTTGSREHVDGGTSRFDAEGIVYQSVCAGCGGTSNFEIKNALYPTNGTIGTGRPNNCNNAIFKFDLEILPTAKFTTSRDTGCAPLTVLFDDESLRSSNFHWDFGNGDTTSTVKNPTRTFSQAGTYLVKLGVTDSICQSTDTAYKYIIVYPELDSFDISNDTITCSTDSLDLWINSHGQANVFEWSTNRNFTTILNAPQDSVVRVVPISGSSPYYYVRANSPNQYCKYIDSVRVEYIPFELNPTFSQDSICEGGVIQITGNFLNVDRFIYDFGNSEIDSTNEDHSYTYTSPGNYTITLYAENNSCNVSDTIVKQVYIAQNNLNLASIPDTIYCGTDSIELIANSFGTAGSFKWGLSPTFSTLINSSLSDSSIRVAPQGNQTYYYQIADEFCELSDTMSVKYITYDPDLVTPDDSGCSPFTVDFDGKAVGATSFNYFFGDGSSNNSATDLQKIYPTPGNYSGYFVTSNSICNVSDTFKFPITVLQGTSAIAPNNTTICYGDFIQLTGNSLGTADRFYWSPNSNFSTILNNPSDSIVNVKPLSTTTYYFKAENEFCSDSSEVNIEVEQVIIDIDDPGPICEGDTVTLNAINLSPNIPLQYSWQPNIEVITGQNTPTITTSPSSDIDFSLIGTSTLGCADTSEAFLEVNEAKYDSATVDATKDTIYKGESTFLSTDLSDPNLVFSWSPSDHLSTPNSETTNATPPATTVYKVTIYDNSTGCTITALKRIVVNEVNCGEPDIFIPTAFTPNNDQVNDVFKVKGNTIKFLSLKIYNRWGQKVYETDDANQGWDGTYQGMEADPGVFVYYLRVSCVDDQEFFKKGNVTLIR